MDRDESEKERGPDRKLVGLTTNPLQLIPVLDTLAIYEARLEEERRLYLKRGPHWWLIILVARGTIVRHCCPKLLGSFKPPYQRSETRAKLQARKDT